MIRRAIGLGALLASVSCAQERDRPPADAAGLRQEAIDLLQGVDTAAAIDLARVRLVGEAVKAIRRKWPELADIPVGPDRSTLVLYATESAASLFVQRSGARRAPGDDSSVWAAPITRVGIRGIDSLNRVFGASEMHLTSMGIVQVDVRFRHPMNIPVLIRSYDRVPEVDFASKPMSTMDGSWISLIAKGRLLHFAFMRGGGDCPAGCTEWDRYYATYDTLNRSVRLEHRVMRGARTYEPISYWDVPTRYSINPYANVDSLYAELREERWWHRQHAVHVIAMLLGKETGPWQGAREQSPAHFTALKTAVLRRRGESFGALIERLSDADSDVAALALSSLRTLSGRAYSSDPKGVVQWRQWLRQGQ